MRRLSTWFIEMNLEDEEREAVQGLQVLLQRQQRESMELSVSIVVAQICKLIPDKVTTWITHQINLTNVSELSKLFEATLQETLSNHREAVEAPLFQEFSTLVEKQCEAWKPRVDQIHTSISEFVGWVDVSLSTQGCFASPQEMEEHCHKEKQKICEGILLLPDYCNDPFVLSQVELACDKLTTLYKIHNQRAFQREKSYAEMITSELKRAYDSEMVKYSLQGPTNPIILQGIHELLEAQFMATFDLMFQTRQALQSVRDKATSKLRADLAESYKSFEESNGNKLKTVAAETQANIESLREKFADNLPPLENQHEGTKDLWKLLKMEIQATSLIAGGTTPNKSIWKSLQSAVDNCWHSDHIVKMYGCVTEAETQVMQTLPKQTKMWIQSGLSLNNLNSFSKAYDATLHQVFVKHRSTVHPSLWEEFTHLVDKKCRDVSLTRLLPVEQAVATFADNIDFQFRQSGYYFSSDHIVCDIYCKEFEKVDQSLEENGFARDAALIACGKVLKEYREFLVIAGKSKQDEVIQKLVKLYMAKMNSICWSVVPHSPDKLKSVHAMLVQECLTTLEKATSHLAQDLDKKTAAIWRLKKYLSKLFASTCEKVNEEKLQNSENEIEMFIEDLVGKYDDMMDVILKQHPEGVNRDLLLSIHETQKLELADQLGEKIKTEILADQTYLNDYIDRFRLTIDDRWQTVNDMNSERSEMKQMTVVEFAKKLCKV